MEILEAIKEWVPIALVAGAAVFGFFRAMLKKKHPTIASDTHFSMPIYEILVELLFKYPATRTFIKQFHNGSEFYSGQKIQRLSISHEKCKPGVTPLKPTHDDLQVPTEVHYIIDDMENNHRDWYFCPDQESVKTVIPELYRWMRSYDVMSVMYFLLSDKKTGSPIGLLGITFNFKFRLDEVTDILDINIKKKEIESEFMKV